MNKTSILQVKTGATDPVQDLIDFFYIGRGESVGKRLNQPLDALVWNSKVPTNI